MISYHSAFAVAILGVTSAIAQTDIPLASKIIPYTDIPYKVDTADGPRGTQTGYNKCGPDTEGQDSLCQTLYLNHLDDFCIWGPPKANQTIADTEGELVAWCTRPGRGTRVIPPGAITGVQFIQTPDYVQVTGNIKQEFINIAAGDSGGEEDSHGADGRGNPLGSIMYSNAFPSNNGNNNTFEQIREWHNFLGGNRFCLKGCDTRGPRAAELCQHIYDRIGCTYNAPASYADGVFESCLGDSQDPPGIYTGSDGKVSTYSQPPESLGPISTMPYQPKVPATSSCVTFQSSDLYAAARSVFPSSSSSATGSTPTGSAHGSGSPSRTGSGSSPSNTSGSSNGALGLGPRGGVVLGFAALAAMVA